ncbi:MAG: phosphatase PAP2 family protein [Clostridia bacterium]
MAKTNDKKNENEVENEMKEKEKNEVKNKNKNKITNINENIKWTVFSICIFIFALIAYGVFRNSLHSFDNFIYNIVSKFISDPLTKVIKAITFLGGPIFLISITGILILIIKNMKNKILVVLNLVLVTALNQSLKYIFSRERPIDINLIEESNFSFPSGHAMLSCAFYGLIIFFVIRYVRNKNMKIILSSLLVTLILLIGLSRIYLGVHFASDVIGGFVITIPHLILFTSYFYASKEKTKIK